MKTTIAMATAKTRLNQCASIPQLQVTAGVGGAITAKALPEHEYDECLLKLRALQLAGVHA